MTAKSCFSTSVYISESMPKHGYFAYVNAKDFDMESNGQVQINVKATAVSSVSGDGVNRDASDMFRLTKDGFLGLNQELDRENESRYLITINATDRGAKPRLEEIGLFCLYIVQVLQ